MQTVLWLFALDWRSGLAWLQWCQSSFGSTLSSAKPRLTGPKMGGLNAFQWMLKEQKVGPIPGAALWKAMDDKVPGRAICSTQFRRILFFFFFCSSCCGQICDAECHKVAQTILHITCQIERPFFCSVCIVDFTCQILHIARSISEKRVWLANVRRELCNLVCKAKREYKEKAKAEREKNKPLSQALRFAAEESEHKSFI